MKVLKTNTPPGLSQNLPDMFLGTQLAQDEMESTEESGENAKVCEEESSILQPTASKPWQLLQPRSRGWASRESHSAMTQPYSTVSTASVLRRVDLLL